MSNPLIDTSNVPGASGQKRRVPLSPERQAQLDALLAEQAAAEEEARAAQAQPVDSRSWGAQTKRAAEPLDIPNPATNPYAPTGWRRKNRVEFDVILTQSGQACRLMRLEREDLFRMNLMGYLDVFTPMLMEDSLSKEARNKKVKETVAGQPSAVANMFAAIDEVVMAACIKPRVTDEPEKVDYGTESDWGNPHFIPTAYIHDICMEDRFEIFASAFGRSMDDLKSLFEQTGGIPGMANVPVVSETTE